MSNSKFWKSQMKAVPGRPSRHKDEKFSKQHNSSSVMFEHFQEKVNDAWEIDEDELLCISDPDVSHSLIQSSVDTLQRHVGHLSFGDDGSDHLIGLKQKSVHLSSSKALNDLPQTHNVTTTNHSHSTVVKNTLTGRSAKFYALLATPQVDLEELRKLSWSGVPSEVRPIVWRLLSGYIPANLEKQQSVLERKRCDYRNLVSQYFNPSEWDGDQNVTYRQIHIDIPRMSQLIALFQQRVVQEMFERILFIWAIRHPASGYVQGINDLVTPFFVIFLKEALKPDEDMMSVELEALPEESRDAIEADCFWCLSKFLDSVQDNYTFAQLGVQRRITKLKELIHRIDNILHKHLQDNGIDYIQFSYRWMNNLLTRELSLNCIIRLWDTYLAEIDSFASFHDYICAAFLEHWRKQLLMEKDFQGLLLTLQNLPTKNWTDIDVGVLIAEAYKLKFSFDDAPNHFAKTDNSSCS